MKEIQLTLSVDDINKILSALGNLPYVQVFELIARLQTQANHQLNGTEVKSESAAFEQ